MHPYGHDGIGYDADDDYLRYQRNMNSDGSISHRGDKNLEDYPGRSATQNREGSCSNNR